MSETIRVPLEGQHVTPQAQAPQPTQQPPQQATERPASGFVHNQYVPPAERQTLQKTRLGVAMRERAERQAAAATPAPAPQPSQTDALSQQINQLTNTVTLLAQHQLGNMQRGHGETERELGELDRLRLHNQYGAGPYDGYSQPEYSLAPDQPDPAMFDHFDPVGAAEFHHQNNGYIQREVQRQLEAAAASQQKMAQVEGLTREAEALRAKFGRDRNFEEVLPAAGQLIVDSGFKLTAEEAYRRVSDEIESRDGKRRSTFMPENITTLGGIERYRRETGRIK